MTLKSKVTEPTTKGYFPMCVNFNHQTINNSESESGRIEFRRNNHKSRLPKNISRWLKPLTPHIPLDGNGFVPLPVVPNCNQFSVLHNPQFGPHNYQNGRKSTRCVSEQPCRTHQNRRVTLTRDKKITCDRQQKKIVVIGHSHLRGLATELTKNHLGMNIQSQEQ
jgi:hypothetical protein